MREQDPIGSNGQGDWLPTYILNSLRSITESLGTISGEMRSNHVGLNSRIDDFRDEMVGRMTRLEVRQLKVETKRPEMLSTLLSLLLSRHAIGIAAMVILGLLGHVGPVEWKAWVLGLKIEH